MEKEKRISEKDRLLYSINRFDHYFESVNNKTAVYLAMNTFLLGGIITGYISVQEHVCQFRTFFNILLTIEMVLGIAGLLVLTVASIPYFSKDSDSLYYFGGIGSMTKQEFFEQSKNLSKKEEMDDLRNQVHLLSQGLNTKFTRLKTSGWLIFFQFVVLALVISILVINKF
ncbi:Pycsar system effector family protein [Flagellimonas sp.]|uniref:Pycsar system effector family protein n=1 Tax=Flagellimonas sp. TaxID=2058762 RepID=UPI003BB1C29E